MKLRSIALIGLLLTLAACMTMPPVITVQPRSQTVIVGQTPTWSVAATGAEPLSYQWSKNGAEISGATAPTYTAPTAAQSDSSAKFQVRVSNAGGVVSSCIATLTVITTGTASSGDPDCSSVPGGGGSGGGGGGGNGGGGGGGGSGTVAKIQLSQGTNCLNLGTEVGFVALAFDAQGLPVLNTALTWQSSNEAAVTVSAAGLARGVGTGQAVITSRSGSVVSNEVALNVPCSILVLERWTGSATYRYSSTGPGGSETRVIEASKVMLEGQRQSSTQGVTLAAVSGEVTYEANRTETGGCIYKATESGTISAALGGFVLLSPDPEPPAIALELKYFGGGVVGTVGTFTETCPLPVGTRTGDSSNGGAWLFIPSPMVVPDFYKCAAVCITFSDEYTRTETNGGLTTTETWTWSFTKLSGG